MNQANLLLELEEAFGRLSDGLNAFKLMAYGMEDIQDPYADGMYAIWRYLDGESKEMRRLLAEVSTLQIPA